MDNTTTETDLSPDEVRLHGFLSDPAVPDDAKRQAVQLYQQNQGAPAAPTEAPPSAWQGFKEAVTPYVKAAGAFLQSDLPTADQFSAANDPNLGQEAEGVLRRAPGEAIANTATVAGAALAPEATAAQIAAQTASRALGGTAAHAQRVGQVANIATLGAQAIKGGIEGVQAWNTARAARAGLPVAGAEIAKAGAEGQAQLERMGQGVAEIGATAELQGEGPWSSGQASTAAGRALKARIPGAAAEEAKNVQTSLYDPIERYARQSGRLLAPDTEAATDLTKALESSSGKWAGLGGDRRPILQLLDKLRGTPGRAGTGAGMPQAVEDVVDPLTGEAITPLSNAGRAETGMNVGTAPSPSVGGRPAIPATPLRDVATGKVLPGQGISYDDLDAAERALNNITGKGRPKAALQAISDAKDALLAGTPAGSARKVAGQLWKLYPAQAAKLAQKVQRAESPGAVARLFVTMPSGGNRLLVASRLFGGHPEEWQTVMNGLDALAQAKSIAPGLKVTAEKVATVAPQIAEGVSPALTSLSRYAQHRAIYHGISAVTGAGIGAGGGYHQGHPIMGAIMGLAMGGAVPYAGTAAKFLTSGMTGRPAAAALAKVISAWGQQHPESQGAAQDVAAALSGVQPAEQP